MRQQYRIPPVSSRSGLLWQELLPIDEFPAPDTDAECQGILHRDTSGDLLALLRRDAERVSVVDATSITPQAAHG